jgi:hypothetical protein
MAKMNWDRVGCEQRLWRSLDGEADPGRPEARPEPPAGSTEEVVIVHAGMLCTCCSRPFIDGDAYYLTRMSKPRHYPVCPGGR